MQLDGSVLVTIIIFALVHTGGFIWWMSRIDTTLKIMSETVKNMAELMSKHDALYYRKEDATKDFAMRDQQINAIWKKVDNLKKD
jgi:hypothetical protein